MPYGESNGHVTDDVTCPRNVKVVTVLCLRANISKTAGDRHLVTWSTNRKWLPGNLLVTSWITLRDPKRSRSWPRYRKMQISRKRSEIEAQYQLTTNRKCQMGNRMDTWPMTSRDQKGQGRDSIIIYYENRITKYKNYVWGPISRKRLEIRTWS